MTPQASILRTLLRADRPVVMAGAHDALSARLVEETGFDAVWASGFAVSASRAVPDASLLTMTDMLEAAQRMAGAVTIPIVADCDGGFGNVINTIHMVQVYERAGIAALCIEDSVFPKRCSLYQEPHRELVDSEEQALKIRAACEARREETVVIARTEAFVAGLGLQEALERAVMYADAGADAILVHSTRETGCEVLDFASHWHREVPLVAVPTTYTGIQVDEFARAGVRVIIFANQAMRASIRAMRETLLQLRADGSAASVEGQIAPLIEVADLVRLDQLRAHERRYLNHGLRVPQ
jgi:phosphoenolpyruvate phosphomutase